LHNNRLAHHELNQLAEEGALFVNGVKAFGLFAAHMDALGRNNAQARFFEHGCDRAG